MASLSQAFLEFLEVQSSNNWHHLSEISASVHHQNSSPVHVKFSVMTHIFFQKLEQLLKHAQTLSHLSAFRKFTKVFPDYYGSIILD